jgi:hypothetical protein
MKGERLSKMMFLRVGKWNPLVKVLDQVLNRLLPSGIPQHLSDLAHSDVFNHYDEEEEDSRRILSLSDLEYGHLAGHFSHSHFGVHLRALLVEGKTNGEKVGWSD